MLGLYLGTFCVHFWGVGEHIRVDACGEVTYPLDFPDSWSYPWGVIWRLQH